MAWIEFHATRIIKLEKFYQLRKDMGWSIAESLGNLGLFWGHTLEVCEKGDISRWTAAYVSDLMGFGAQVSERFLDRLRFHGWVNSNGLIHDWLDYSGNFLRGKYAGNNKEKLVEIWKLHGREYGESAKPIGNLLVTNRKPIIPNRTKPNLTKYTTGPPIVPPGGESALKFDANAKFEEIWDKYPKKFGKKQAKRHFIAFVKNNDDYRCILNALKNYCDYLAREKKAEKYILNGKTWFNNWQDYEQIKIVIPSLKTMPPPEDSQKLKTEALK